MLNYQQTNGTGIIMKVVDTPMVDEVFLYGLNAGIEIINGSGGVSTTKLTIPSMGCDSVRHCLLVEGYGTHVSIGILESSGQQGTASGIPLGSAGAIHIDGSAVIQVCHLWEDYVNVAPVVITSRTACSRITIGDAYVDYSQSRQANVNFLNSLPCPTGSYDAVYLATSPRDGGETGPKAYLFSWDQERRNLVLAHACSALICETSSIQIYR